MSQPTIARFSGPYRFLSNFVGAVTTADGRIWPSVEHAYQAAKTLNYEVQEQIRSTRNPGDAKRIGRGVNLRSDWIDVRHEIMEDLVRRKFSQSPDLRARLLATSPARLIEGNDWEDRYWGVCRGEGENKLGEILMQVRREMLRLRVEQETS